MQNVTLIAFLADQPNTVYLVGTFLCILKSIVFTKSKKHFVAYKSDDFTPI